MGAVLHEVVIPRICELTSSVSNRRMAGFLFFRAWIYLAFFSPALIPHGTQSDFFLLNDCSRLALTVSLLVFGLGFGKTLEKTSLGSLSAAGAAAIVLGTLLASLTNTTTTALRAAFVAGSLLTGVGSAALFLALGKAYKKTAAPRVAAEVSVAFILSSLATPLACFLAAEAATFLAVVFPILSWAALRRYGNEEEDETEITPDFDIRQSNRLLAKITIAVVSFSVALSLLRTTLNTAHSEMLSLQSSGIVAFSAVFGGLIVLGILVFSKKLSLAFSYKPVLWLAAAGCFLFTLLDFGSFLPYFFARTGYVCFTILTWVVLADISRRGSLPWMKVFGIGQAGIAFGSQIGSKLSIYFTTTDNLPSETLVATTGAITLLLVFVYTFVLTELDISRIFPSKTAPGKEPDSAPSGPTRKELAQAVASFYKLGDRATEVMVLYSQGYTRKRIEQELFMSEGTVNSHLRNIYASLDVHSKQELIDLIEGYNE